MLPGLARTGHGHGLAVAWPGHGQVALGAKSQVPLARSLARPWPGPGQTRPDNIFLEVMINHK